MTRARRARARSTWKRRRRVVGFMLKDLSAGVVVAVGLDLSGADHQIQGVGPGVTASDQVEPVGGVVAFDQDLPAVAFAIVLVCDGFEPCDPFGFHRVFFKINCDRAVKVS